MLDLIWQITTMPNGDKFFEIRHFQRLSLSCIKNLDNGSITLDSSLFTDSDEYFDI